MTQDLTEETPGAASLPPTQVAPTFEDMRLKVGDKIQLQVPSGVGQERYLVKLIGYIENVGLLVTAPQVHGAPVPLLENDKLIVRTFSSQRVFGFSSTLERVCKLPYNYLHLSFPSKIEGVVIRNSPRIRTRLTSTIVIPGTEGAKEESPSMIANLSADGALVKTSQYLCDKGKQLQLSFNAKLHGADTTLKLDAVVLSSFLDHDKTDSLQPAFNYGVKFLDLTQSDRVTLLSLVYQQIVERPNSLI